MVKVEIKQTDYNIEAEVVLDKEVKKFAKTSGHIIVPKKWIGYKAFVVIRQLAGSWAKGMKQHSKKKGQF